MGPTPTGKFDGPEKDPPPLPRRIETLLPWEFATDQIGLAIAIEVPGIAKKYVVPTPRRSFVAAPKEPVPSPRSIETVSLNLVSHDEVELAIAIEVRDQDAFLGSSPRRSSVAAPKDPSPLL